MEYYFRKLHRPNVKYQESGALSSLPCGNHDNCDIGDELSIMAVTAHAYNKLNKGIKFGSKKSQEKLRKVQLLDLTGSLLHKAQT